MLAAWERKVGLSGTGTLTLVAIVSLVILVSLPRLHGFALAENERDAVLTVRRLMRELEALPVGGEVPTLDALISGGRMSRELSDAELLDGGALLRRHGYLFRLERAAAPRTEASAPAGEESRSDVVLVAWPWEVRRTGSLVVVGSPGGVLQAHPNEEGRWSGRAQPPEARAAREAGWRTLP